MLHHELSWRGGAKMKATNASDKQNKRESKSYRHERACGACALLACAQQWAEVGTLPTGMVTSRYRWPLQGRLRLLRSAPHHTSRTRDIEDSSVRS